MPSEMLFSAVVVCVPAKDEAERISILLSALAAQSVVSSSNPLKVVVVCNNTTDDTATIVRDFAAAALTIRIVEVNLPQKIAHAGTARRMAMDLGAGWLDEIDAHDGILISTDADAIPPASWVAANVAALEVADVVGGRLVDAGDAEDASPALVRLHERIERYWAAVRTLEDHIDPPVHDPAPRHGDHTGASLALRVSTYRDAGGVPLLPCGEDNALVATIEKRGGRVRHCPEVWIAVSAREHGRAKGGMAAEMVRRRRVVMTDAVYELPTADYWRNRLVRRASLRARWVDDGAFPNSIAYVARHEASVIDEHVPVEPVEMAIAELEAMVRPRRRGHAA